MEGVVNVWGTYVYARTRIRKLVWNATCTCVRPIRACVLQGCVRMHARRGWHACVCACMNVRARTRVSVFRSAIVIISFGVGDFNAHRRWRFGQKICTTLVVVPAMQRLLASEADGLPGTDQWLLALFARLAPCLGSDDFFTRGGILVQG